MFHSLKCHWELGSTFIRRFCHFRTRFVILDPTSSSLELVGVMLALEWFRAGTAHIPAGAVPLVPLCFPRKGLRAEPDAVAPSWFLEWNSQIPLGISLDCPVSLSFFHSAQGVYAVTSENPLISGAYFPLWGVKNECHRLYFIFFSFLGTFIFQENIYINSNSYSFIGVVTFVLIFICLFIFI